MNIMVKTIGLLICCCNKYYAQYEKISKIWNNIIQKYNDIQLFYLFGDKSISNTIVDIVSNKLIIKMEDIYENLPKKIYEALTYIYNNYPTIQHIFKTDDDIEFENYDEIINEIRNKIELNADYAGLITESARGGYVKENKLHKFNNPLKIAKYDKSVYCYGAGYLLSKKSIRIITENKSYMYSRCLEDVSIGHLLNNKNIYPIKMKSKFKEVR